MPGRAGGRGLRGPEPGAEPAPARRARGARPGGDHRGADDAQAFAQGGHPPALRVCAGLPRAQQAVLRGAERRGCRGGDAGRRAQGEPRDPRRIPGRDPVREGRHARRGAGGGPRGREGGRASRRDGGAPVRVPRASPGVRPADPDRAGPGLHRRAVLRVGGLDPRGLGGRAGPDADARDVRVGADRARKVHAAQGRGCPGQAHLHRRADGGVPEPVRGGLRGRRGEGPHGHRRDGGGRA